MSAALPLPEDLSKAVRTLVSRTPKSAVGPAVRLLRDQAGFTQTQLATRFGRRRTTVVMWENGQRQPPVGLTRALLAFLKVPPDALPASDLSHLPNPVEYSGLDNLDIAKDFVDRTWLQVFTAVADRAKEGSPPDSKLYRDWMKDIEAEYAARTSKAISVSDRLANRRHWQNGKPSQLPAETVSGAPLQDVVVQEVNPTQSLLCDTTQPQDVEQDTQSSNGIDTQTAEG